MKRILFRFHRAYDICEQNLSKIADCNPGVEIHGLYGGQDKISNLPRGIKKYMATIDQPFDDPYYCWKNADLAVRKWHQQTGFKFKFAHLYLLEWDLMLVEPLDGVYGKLQRDTNYTSIHATYRQARRKDWWWIRDKFELKSLKNEIAAQAKPVTNDVSFGVMPGTVFCRRFLDRYSAVYPSSYLNDEARLSYWSQGLGIGLRDNGFKKPPNLVRCDDNLLKTAEIEAALKAGAKALHPLRTLLPSA